MPASNQSQRLTGATTKKKSVKNGKRSNPTVIKARLKAADALKLRMEGKTFALIATELKYNSPQSAYDAVKRALDSVIREPAEALVRTELERLDVLWEIQYLNAQAGDTASLAACLKLMDRRARYLGLDAPVKGEITGANGQPLVGGGVFVLPPVMSPEEWERRAREQQAALTAAHLTDETL